MRSVSVLAVLLFTAGTSHADKKIVDMTPLFVKESAGCETQAAGLAKVSTGATALVATLEGAEKVAAEEDTQRVVDALAQIRAHCDEVAGMVTFLKDNAKSSYRAVEKELDQRDNRIRKGRAATKKLLAELTPVTRRLIPMIAKKKVAAPAKATLPAQKFPSGRSVELPALVGTWSLSGSAASDSADYVEKAITASVTARAKVAQSCDQLKAAFVGDPAVERLEYAEIPSDAKAIGVQWRITYRKAEKAGERFYNELCAQKGTDTYRVTAIVSPSSNTALAERLVPLAVQMLSAQVK